ncbi:MAG: AAA family ATPase [Thermoplasmatota archaeon]
MTLKIIESPDFDYPQERRMFSKIKSILEDSFKDSYAILIPDPDFEGSDADALLIQDDAITIIELKDYSGDIEGSENGDWICRKDKKIIEINKGRKNPFIQVNGYRRSLINKLDSNKKSIFKSKFLEDIIKKGVLAQISCLILFSGPINDKTEINKRKYPWFNITDMDNLEEEVFNIHSPGLDPYLNKTTMDKIRKVLVPKYDDELRQKIENAWDILEEALNEWNYFKNKKARKKFLELKDKVTNLELEAACDHGIALTELKYNDMIKSVCEVFNDYYPQYKGYKNHDLIQDIFEFGYYGVREELENIKININKIFEDLKEANDNKKIKKAFLGFTFNHSIRSKNDPPTEFTGQEQHYGGLALEMGKYLEDLYPDDEEILLRMYFGYYNYLDISFTEKNNKICKLAKSGILSDFKWKEQIIPSYLWLSPNLPSFKDFKEFLNILKESKVISEGKMYEELADYQIEVLSKPYEFGYEVKEDKKDEYPPELDPEDFVNFETDEIKNQIENLLNKAFKTYQNKIEEKREKKDILEYLEFYENRLEDSEKKDMLEKTKNYLEILLKKNLDENEYYLPIRISKNISKISGSKSLYNKFTKKAKNDFPKSVHLNTKRGLYNKELNLKEEAIRSFESALHNLKNETIFMSIKNWKDLPKIERPKKLKDRTDESRISTLLLFGKKYVGRFDKPFYKVPKEKELFDKEAEISFNKLGELLTEKNDYHGLIRMVDWLLNYQDVMDSEQYIYPNLTEASDILKYKFEKDELKDDKINEKEIEETKSFDLDLSDYAMNNELRKDIEFFIHKLNNNKPVSLLFHGPPGTGKSYLARCIAGEIGFDIEILDSSVLSKWVGETEKNMTDLFKKIREEKNKILIIDEFEAFANDRQNSIRNHELSLTDELLKQIEKTKKKKNMPVMIIATTNYLGKIDAAVKRKGRFDQKIEFNVPDKKERENLIELEISKFDSDDFGFKDDINYELLAKKTNGLTHADIHQLFDYNIEKEYFHSKEKPDKIDEEFIIDTIQRIKEDEEMDYSYIR